MDSARRLTVTGLIALWAAAHACPLRAQIRAIGELTLSGRVETVTSDGLTIRDSDGAVHTVRVQRPQERGIALSDGTLLAAPATVSVVGEVPVSGVQPGRVVRFKCRLDKTGKVESPVDSITVIEGDAVELGVGTPAPTSHAASTATQAARFVEADVTATVKTVTTGGTKRLIVELPPERAYNRKTVLAVPLAAKAVARLESADPGRIAPGARVVALEAIRLQTGDLVARSLEVENAATKTVADTGDEALERKYRSLSNQPPPKPRLVRSAHFAFMTDVSDREWAVISFKLERMVSALEAFLGRRMTGVVQGFVARDLDAFPPGMIDDEYGVAKIRRGEGVCVNSRLGPQRQARLYSCGDHGVIQHECIHGICHLTFGSTGPTWLAEGLAELGQYWKENDQTVTLPAPVVGHLQTAEPKRKLLEIAAPGRTDAGTWEDYAWRWALCHLLANNPNYANRFVPLAIGLMEERPGVSFESVYGPVAREVSFEYDQFLATLGNGYRSDLTAWPWKAKFQRLADSATKTVAVKARAGWQPSGMLVDAGVAYRVAAEGSWRIAAAGEPLAADGEADGRGRLVAAVFADFGLSPEIPLGRETRFTPPTAGQLFFRCADAWTELADNDGEITVRIDRAP